MRCGVIKVPLKSKRAENRRKVKVESKCMNFSGA